MSTEKKKSAKSSIRYSQGINSNMRTQVFYSYPTALSVLAFSSYDFQLQVFKMDVTPPGISSEIKRVVFLYFYLSTES